MWYINLLLVRIESKSISDLPGGYVEDLEKTEREKGGQERGYMYRGRWPVRKTWVLVTTYNPVERTGTQVNPCLGSFGESVYRDNKKGALPRRSFSVSNCVKVTYGKCIYYLPTMSWSPHTTGLRQSGESGIKRSGLYSWPVNKCKGDFDTRGTKQMTNGTLIFLKTTVKGCIYVWK